MSDTHQQRSCSSASPAAQGFDSVVEGAHAASSQHSSG